MSEVIIGVDLGGTRIRAARLDQELNILAREETLTYADQGPQAVLRRMIELIRAVLPDEGITVTGIGVSSPGPLNPATGVILAPPNLPGWHNVPLAQSLREAFSMPVFVGNDANVAVLAEVARGAAQGSKNAIYITVSTGIGGGILSDGRLLLGQEGFAAEIGFLALVVDGDRVSYLEPEAAGPALARQAVARLEAGAASIMRDMVQGDLTQVDSKVIGQAAEQGDVVAREIIERGGRMIGLGIVSLLHLFNPQVIVVGGGVSNVGELLFAPMRAAVEKNVIDPAYVVPIRQAALGENVSIIGAAALVKTQGGFVPLLE